MPSLAPTYWPSARHFAEAIQCPGLSFSNPQLRGTLAAVDRLGMPLVTSGQFAYVYKLKLAQGGAFAVRCFRGHLGDREQRYHLINEHLRRHSIPALASFAYEPEGILVTGRRFPILVMEWVEGLTLDVYLDEAVNRREVLLHLADEWVRLMEALRGAGVAHGDLQHGNIIVERGQLRLVDLDGMFVPAMSGWPACEMGHQHYQHPSRDAALFSSSLDDFSALVVYLSLISLAERPELWAEHHDENLLFTKDDFLAPARSALFAKIKEIGAEHRKLAEALEAAALASPEATPALTELVSRKTKLPSWMVAPLDIEVSERTREATPAEVAALSAEAAQWTPWQSGRSVRPMPVSPGSNAVQSVFSNQPQQVTPSRPLRPSTLNTSSGFWEITRHGFRYALDHNRNKQGRVRISPWLAGTAIFFSNMLVQEAGLPSIYFLAVIAFFIFVRWLPALVHGFERATDEANNTPVSQMPGGATAALPHTSYANSAYANPSSASGPLPFWLWNQPATSVPQSTLPPPLTQPMAAAAMPIKHRIVGSRALGIYHHRDCEWALKITKENLVGFSTASKAHKAGYHPCQVCSP